MEGLSPAAWLAYVYQEGGEAALRQLLDMVALDRESLMRAAIELEETGLGEIAAIVAEAPPEAEVCPFDLQSDPCNYRDWHRRHRRDFTGFLLDDRDRATRLRQLGYKR